MKEPKFWYQSQSTLGKILFPVSLCYYYLGLLFAVFKKRHKINVPIICIGNLNLGGVGKTPVAIFFAQKLLAQGYKVHFVSRGYKGFLKGPIQVSSHHNFEQVGDEPLLLARIAPTWISKNRFQGAKAAQNSGADFIIFDDGYQNSTMIKDFSFLVIDTYYKFGNQYLFPAGPLREPIQSGLDRAQGVILIGKHEFNVPDHLPSLRIEFKPDLKDLELLKNKNIILFAGIGRPDKFFNMMKEYVHHYHYKIVENIAFADHYIYKDSDLHKLMIKAQKAKALLVTTEKDLVKFTQIQNILSVRLVLDIIEGDWACVQKIFFPDKNF